MTRLTCAANLLPDATTIFLLQRTRLYADATFQRWLRFYGEALDATSDGNEFIERVTEINRFDAINLFVEALLFDDVANGSRRSAGTHLRVPASGLEPPMAECNGRI